MMKPTLSKSRSSGRPKTTRAYSYLEQLPMTLVAPAKDAKYHNMRSDNIRRNEIWHQSVVLKQKTVFDFGEMSMLARIHICDMKVASLNVYISEFRDGPFHSAVQSETLKQGSERVIKIGCLPCRYVMIEMEMGVPICDPRKVKCFGLKYSEVDSVLGEGYSDVLFDSAYELIFHSKQES